MIYYVTILDSEMKELHQEKMEFNGTPMELAKQVAEREIALRKKVSKSLGKVLGEDYAPTLEIQLSKKCAAVIGPGGVDHYVVVEEDPSRRWDGLLEKLKGGRE